ncbi:MAG: deaminase [Patescibacteria group bacterium]
MKDVTILERDIRALSPVEVVSVCKALSLAPVIKLLEKENISDLKRADAVVFANDEVMRAVAESYCVDIPVAFEPVFLRWDKMAAVTAVPVTFDNEISQSDFDREFISRARSNAQKSSDWWRQVGAVIVKEGKLILEGYNQHKPTENTLYIDGDPRGNFDAGDPQLKDMNMALHGEAGLIARAAQKGISLEGTSIYVTTFPCPTCALSIIQAGIKKVYYADGYSNLGAEHNLRSAGIKLIRVKEN